jgi:hypothetical protein
MSSAAPPNSAQTAALQPIHIHIVDDFNLDASLEAAATMLSSRHLASCDQIRISCSGLHPSLNAHPKLTSKQANYGSTTFAELQPLLGWDETTLKRNLLIGNGPRNFLQLDRKLAAKNTLLFDLVFCCAKDVFEGICSYYSARSFSTTSRVGERPPHTIFVIFFDSKFCKTTTTKQEADTEAMSANNNKSSSSSSNSKKLSQGALFTSLALELLDLIHLRQVVSNNNESDSASAVVPQHVQNSNGTQKWKEEFARSVKQFEQLRRVEVTFKPFVI